MVAQDRKRVEVFARAVDGEWEHHARGEGELVELPSLAMTFSVDELYEAAGVL